MLLDSDTASQTTALRRSGDETRRAAQRIALDLFTAHGYEATSLREIAEALGINKASLYYHFRSKEDILRSLFHERSNEADDLLHWLGGQPRTPDLVGATVMRWVGLFSADKVRGIKFLTANPRVARAARAAGGDQIGANLNQLVDALTALIPNPSGVDVVMLRMAILSINAAVEAAAGTDLSDDDVLAAARCASGLLVAQLI